MKKQQKETALNLYLYIASHVLPMHLIVLVSGKPYQLSGSEEEKRAFLKERANADWKDTIKEKVACPYNDYKIMPMGQESFNLPDNVVPLDFYQLQPWNKRLAFFELLFQRLEKMGMKISDNPLVCITPLKIGANTNDITPVLNGFYEFDK